MCAFGRSEKGMEFIMIKKADLKKALEIYDFMEKDFPKSEIPDVERYTRFTKENIHNVYMYEEDQQEVAYFITIEKAENGKVLITHLAVIEEYRGKGVGKRFIEEIKKFFSDKKILIVEVESEKNAKNEQELKVIEKRINYYINAGFKKREELEYNLFNVDFYILTYSPSSERISSIEMKKTIQDIYEGLFPKENLVINIREL